MTWQRDHGDWILRGLNGKRLGIVYRTHDGWCAETDGPGLTSGPGDLEWAQETLLNYCKRWHPEQVRELV